jgi:hypothetical protein
MSWQAPQPGAEEEDVKQRRSIRYKFHFLSLSGTRWLLTARSCAQEASKDWRDDIRGQRGGGEQSFSAGGQEDVRGFPQPRHSAYQYPSPHPTPPTLPCLTKGWSGVPLSSHACCRTLCSRCIHTDLASLCQHARRQLHRQHAAVPREDWVDQVP